jgi:hypothetical protein
MMNSTFGEASYNLVYYDKPREEDDEEDIV